MELQEKKINRSVYFLYTPVYDSEADPPGNNNRWIYDRAPEGYKFVLVAMDVSSRISGDTTKAVLGLFDGHEFTNWLIFPGVESKEYLCRSEYNIYQPSMSHDLHGWECKEFTIGGRNFATAEDVKFCIIIWYYLEKMDKLEEYQYAVIQPKGDKPIRKGGATTVESTEA